MSTDLVRTIAFAYRYKAAEKLPGSTLRLVLAYDLRWFAPEDAKRAVARALEAGLLVEDGEDLRPTFDVAAVEVPVNFRPGAGVFHEPVPTDLPAAPAVGQTPRPAPAPAPAAAPAPAPAPAPASASASASASPAAAARSAAAAEERARRGNLVRAEVAELIVARRAGEDVRARAAALAQAMLT